MNAPDVWQPFSNGLTTLLLGNMSHTHIG